MIVAGTLTDRITVLRPVTVKDEYGSQNTTFEDRGSIWANVRYMKGDAALTAGESWMSKSVSITIRYTSLVTERCRIGWDGKTYRITSLNRDRANGSVSIVAEYIDEEN